MSYLFKPFAVKYLEVLRLQSSPRKDSPTFMRYGFNSKQFQKLCNIFINSIWIFCFRDAVRKFYKQERYKCVWREPLFIETKTKSAYPVSVYHSPDADRRKCLRTVHRTLCWKVRMRKLTWRMSEIWSSKKLYCLPSWQEDNFNWWKD